MNGQYLLLEPISIPSFHPPPLTHLRTNKTNRTKCPILDIIVYHKISLSPVLNIVGILLYLTELSIMDIHNSTIYTKDGKYSCDICGHQVTQKKSLEGHKKIVHDGVKFCCSQCNYQATTKGNLARHKRAVHEGVKYACG